MDSRIISNLLHGRKSLKNPLLVVKSQDFQKCEKWPFLNILQRLYTVRQIVKNGGFCRWNRYHMRKLGSNLSFHFQLSFKCLLWNWVSIFQDDLFFFYWNRTRKREGVVVEFENDSKLSTDRSWTHDLLFTWRAL